MYPALALPPIDRSQNRMSCSNRWPLPLEPGRAVPFSAASINSMLR